MLGLVLWWMLLPWKRIRESLRKVRLLVFNSQSGVWGNTVVAIKRGQGRCGIRAFPDRQPGHSINTAVPAPCLPASNWSCSLAGAGKAQVLRTWTAWLHLMASSSSCQGCAQSPGPHLGSSSSWGGGTCSGDDGGLPQGRSQGNQGRAAELLGGVISRRRGSGGCAPSPAFTRLPTATA